MAFDREAVAYEKEQQFRRDLLKTLERLENKVDELFLEQKELKDYLMNRKNDDEEKPKMNGKSRSTKQ